MRHRPKKVNAEAARVPPSPSGKGSRNFFPPETVEYLKAWMMSPEHIDHPYPTEEEKAKIMADTGIGMRQLTNWFVNNRKRYWKPRVEERRKQAQADASNKKKLEDLNAPMSPRTVVVFPASPFSHQEKASTPEDYEEDNTSFNEDDQWEWQGTVLHGGADGKSKGTKIVANHTIVEGRKKSRLNTSVEESTDRKNCKKRKLNHSNTTKNSQNAPTMPFIPPSSSEKTEEDNKNRSELAVSNSDVEKEYLKKKMLATRIEAAACKQMMPTEFLTRLSSFLGTPVTLPEQTRQTTRIYGMDENPTSTVDSVGESSLRRNDSWVELNAGFQNDIPEIVEGSFQEESVSIPV